MSENLGGEQVQPEISRADPIPAKKIPIQADQRRNFNFDCWLGLFIKGQTISKANYGVLIWCPQLFQIKEKNLLS